MRTLVQYAAAVILLCGSAAAAPQRPGFDFSAVEQTWRIAGILDILPQSGHPTGYSMARTIIERLGKERLASVLGDPALKG